MQTIKLWLVLPLETDLEKRACHSELGFFLSIKILYFIHLMFKYPNACFSLIRGIFPLVYHRNHKHGNLLLNLHVVYLNRFEKYSINIILSRNLISLP